MDFTKVQGVVVYTIRNLPFAPKLRQMFKKLVAIEPVGLIPSAEKELKKFTHELIMYDDIPKDDDEVAARIGDADGVLLSYLTYYGLL